MANQDENGQTFCPQCKSKNWYCWDESTDWFYDPALIPEWEDEGIEPGYFEFPVGYMKCKDCECQFLSHPEFSDTTEHIGSTHELNKLWYGNDYDG